jgi:hypothetical protein
LIETYNKREILAKKQNVKKDQMEILEMKNTVTEVQMSMVEFKSRMEENESKNLKKSPNLSNKEKID